MARRFTMFGFDGYRGLPPRGPLGHERRDPFEALPGEINWDPVDRFTLAHFGAGVGTAILGFPWWAALIAAIGWDLLERLLKRAVPQIFPHYTQDTPQHVAVDVAAWMVGWGLMRQALYWRERALPRR